MKLLTHITAPLALACGLLFARGQTPENLVLEGVPPIPPELRSSVAPYLEFRTAVFRSWHPVKREMLITTRFADTMQLHHIKMPGGARHQLTFSSEPVSDAAFRPADGRFIVFAQDVGGGEFYQLYRYDLADGRITLLTDGKSRNTAMRWSHSGKWLAYSSTRRNGTDTDIYVIDPANPSSNRLLVQVKGGGWSVQDWSRDDSKLLLMEYISINQSRVYLADAQTGATNLITRDASGEKVSYGQARFSKHSIYVTTDKNAEFQRLSRLNAESGQLTPLTAHINWDVSEFEVSPDGQMIAFVTNEAGVSKLQLLDVTTEQPLPPLPVPAGVIAGLRWHESSKNLGFTLTSANSPSDAYALELGSTGWQLLRWTQSETGGLNPERFVEPELVQMRSYDEVPISAFVYRPDPEKFPGKRPVLVSIHGGPEAQTRPVFQARNNYYLNEMGIAIVYPNVRGSAGYGKTFLTLDNGFKREDSVRDIGTVLDWIERDPRLESSRVGVIGGSYGGYMVLASMVHFSDRLRCGVDVVGISNFLTFLRNTQDYRRDLRRVEYGDERDEDMRQFLDRISPNNHVDKMKKPLLVVQGKNDPRVPLAESEQMIAALREKGRNPWYLMAKDEGHGFAKKRNADFQFLVTVLFLQKHLLE
jgi:dipeptidyl aminopeptidase/acylaminoacyl peptidase